MAETMGSVIDKICIMELKIFHTQAQVNRTDATEELRTLCQNRLVILKRQRDDLVGELNGLGKAWSAAEWKPKVYRQFKMYNDPRFRIKPRA